MISESGKRTAAPAVEEPPIPPHMQEEASRNPAQAAVAEANERLAADAAARAPSTPPATTATATITPTAPDRRRR